jgi:hypothetical protein
MPSLCSGIVSQSLCCTVLRCLRAKNAVRLGDDATLSNRLVRDPATIDRQRHTGDGCGAIGA